MNKEELMQAVSLFKEKYDYEIDDLGFPDILLEIEAEQFVDKYSFKYHDYSQFMDDTLELIVVFKNTESNESCFISFTGSYSSWDGTEWSGSDPVIVEKKKKIIESEYWGAVYE